MNTPTGGGVWYTMPPIIFGEPQFQTREQELEYKLRQTESQVKQHQDLLEKLRRPHPFASVISINDAEGTVLISCGPQLMEVEKPQHLPNLKPADFVMVHNNTRQIIKIIKREQTGRILLVSRDLGDGWCEVDVPGAGPHAIRYYGTAPKALDRIICDITGALIARNLGPAPAPQAWSGDTGVSWDDVGGLTAAKRELQEAIEGPVTKRELYEKYGKKPTKGVLLWGPPGTGKTLLAKAAATALAKIYGASAKASGWQFVKGPEILDKFVGESERGVRRLFESARDHRQRNGYPAVIFIDEADALLGKRGVTRWEGMERTIVPQFLAEMDGLDETGAIVLLATNRPDVLDPAVVRDGRIDRRIHVARPDRADTEDILRKHLKGKPLDGIELGDFAERIAAEIFSPAHVLYRIRCKGGDDRRFTLGHVVSGALCAGLVERVTQHAIRRDDESGTVTGIRVEDLQTAIADVVDEQAGIDHGADLADFVEPLKDKVERIDRVKTKQEGA